MFSYTVTLTSEELNALKAMVFRVAADRVVDGADADDTFKDEVLHNLNFKLNQATPSRR